MQQNDWVFRKTPEEWEHLGDQLIRGIFTCLVLVFLTNFFFFRLWWAELILYLIIALLILALSLAIYAFGQTNLLIITDKLIVKYQENGKERKAYVLSDEYYSPENDKQIYFLTSTTGEILMNDEMKLLAFSTLKRAQEYAKQLERECQVMTLTLDLGDAIE